VTEIDPPIPGGNPPRPESLGEAEYRVGGWLLTVLRLFSTRYHGKRFEDAAATLAEPILEEYPSIRNWKAPKK